jgi:hypothetical protein
MRLWSIHPCYLDTKGLLALWREALLAKKVLSRKTKGYKHHPQLLRFQKQDNPLAAINTYLKAVHIESLSRGYAFDQSKIGRGKQKIFINVTSGQLEFELAHLRKKLWRRNRKKYFDIKYEGMPKAHPLFKVVEGIVEDWEKR